MTFYSPATRGYCKFGRPARKAHRNTVVNEEDHVIFTVLLQLLTCVNVRPATVNGLGLQLLIARVNVSAAAVSAVGLQLLINAEVHSCYVVK